MTDPSDKQTRRSTEKESQEAEVSTPVTGSKTEPTRPEKDKEVGTTQSGEDNEVSGPLTLEERQQLTLVQSEEIIEDPSKPSVGIEQVTPPATGDTKISIRQNPDTITANVRPGPPVSEQESYISPHQIEIEQIPDQLGASLQLQQAKTSDQQPQSVRQHAIKVTRSSEQIKHESRPSTQTLLQGRGQQTLLDEIEDGDPLFAWNGGHPYGSDRPRLILHHAENKEQLQSFQFLQRLLRDTFAELEGGEPTVEQVEFVANEAQIPSVGSRIISLDLTTGEWTPSVDNGRPTIERGGIDIVSVLAEQAKTLYSGDLGFLVVNVPGDWESTYRRRNFFDNLLTELADVVPTGDGDTQGAFEMLRSAPVTVARPRVTDSDSFRARVAQYYGYEYVPQYETIDQIDTSFMAALRSDRWTKVALTERQSYGEESSRHYNWKALLTEGVTRALWNAASDGDRPFTTFVRQELLPDGAIKTEHPLGSGTESDTEVIVDIYLSEKGAQYGSKPRMDFFGGELPDLPLAIEFETGFSEATFGYRKLVESIKKYDQIGFKGTLLVVVPPRLLYRGEQKARHLESLVQYHGEHLEGTNVRLCIPTISESRCTSLQTTSDLITKLYDND